MSAIWYRVEIGPEGNVVSCEPAKPSNGSGSRVFFVEAKTNAHAAELALRRHSARLRLERKALLVKEGRCGWCSRKTDRAPGLKCLKCLAREAERQKERRKIERGELAERTPRISPNRERSEEQLRKLKIELLREVQKAWQSAQSNSAFTRWLEHNLSKLLAEAPSHAPDVYPQHGGIAPTLNTNSTH